jgi:hypothetical protein
MDVSLYKKNGGTDVKMAEEKSKKKKREPYRKSSRMGKRAVIPFLIPIIFIGLTILLVVVIVKAPEICLPFVKTCWRLVPLRWTNSFLFWMMFLSFFLVQAVFIFAYIKVVGNGMQYANRIIAFLKHTSTNIETWFLKVSH